MMPFMDLTDEEREDAMVSLRESGEIPPLGMTREELDIFTEEDERERENK